MNFKILTEFILFYYYLLLNGMFKLKNIRYIFNQINDIFVFALQFHFIHVNQNWSTNVKMVFQNLEEIATI